MGERSPEPQAPASTWLEDDLTPERQAYRDLLAHSLQCTPCQDVAEGPCATGKELWQAWRRLRRGDATPAQ
ncbi:hypothetical protein ACR9VJ_26620 [Streptomyces sp. H49]|uniref:hypothetical protein n=1 Tax=Streptomyces sp. H49 TaxID=3444117 RepID=UPI003F4AB857